MVNDPTSVVTVAVYVPEGLMLMGGGDAHEGLFSVALRSGGQLAEVVMAPGAVSPEPPRGAGLVAAGEVAGVVAGAGTVPDPTERLSLI
jgi:hypothetical protein